MSGAPSMRSSRRCPAAARRHRTSSGSWPRHQRSHGEATTGKTSTSRSATSGPVRDRQLRPRSEAAKGMVGNGSTAMASGVAPQHAVDTISLVWKWSWRGGVPSGDERHRSWTAVSAWSASSSSTATSSRCACMGSTQIRRQPARQLSPDPTPPRRDGTQRRRNAKKKRVSKRGLIACGWCGEIHLQIAIQSSSIYSIRLSIHLLTFVFLSTG